VKATVTGILIVLPVSSASSETDTRPSQDVGVVAKMIGIIVFMMTLFESPKLKYLVSRWIARTLHLRMKMVIMLFPCSIPLEISL
jgi:hypothetical protein